MKVAATIILILVVILILLFWAQYSKCMGQNKIAKYAPGARIACNFFDFNGIANLFSQNKPCSTCGQVSESTSSASTCSEDITKVKQITKDVACIQTAETITCPYNESQKVFTVNPCEKTELIKLGWS